MPRKPKPRKVRSYGVGRIFRRGDVWYVEFRGQRYSTGKPDESAAIEKLAELHRQHARGELDAGPDAYNIAELLDDYLKRKKLAPGTRATYESQAKLHLRPFFGSLPISKLTTDVLTDYRESRERQEVQQGNNAKPGHSQESKRAVNHTSINRELAFLRAALRDLAKRRPKAVPSLPYFPMEREDNARQGFINEVAFEGKLLPQLPRHWRAPAICAFFCGGRRGEWANADWEDVDFEHLIFRFPKTKNKQPREVPIYEGLMLDALHDAKKIHDAVCPDEPAVFTYDGRRFLLGGSAWEKACKRAGFDGLLFHDMRRSANKAMRDHGVPQPVRMQIMGHKTASLDIRYGIVDRENIDTARQQRSSPKRPQLKRVK